MSRRKKIRCVSNVAAIIICLVFVAAAEMGLDALIGGCVVLLMIDLGITLYFGRCPYCHKPLRSTPFQKEEYCSHCGQKIE